jgi:hypothetical protein
MRTAKSCGPGAPMLASSCADVRAATVARKPVHRGEHAISRKPSRREGRDASAEPVCSCAFPFVQLAHETAGAARTRLSLRPLLFREGAKLTQTSGISCRENADAYLPVVIARESGRSSTPRPLGSSIGVSGILDRPVIGERKRCRPSDGYAGRRQVESCLKIESDVAPSLRAKRRTVGWVERSETHQLHRRGMMGFASLYPSYEPF